MLIFIFKAVMAVTRTTSRVADLIQADPAGWKIDAHEAVHTSGLRVWIANKDYGLTVYTDLDGFIRSKGKFWEPSWAERRLIWDAFSSLRRAEDNPRRVRIEAKIQKTIDEAYAKAEAA